MFYIIGIVCVGYFTLKFILCLIGAASLDKAKEDAAKYNERRY